MNRKVRMMGLAGVGLLMALAGGHWLQAQTEAPPPGPGDRPDRPGNEGRRFDPAQMQERMLEGLKMNLQPSDEEWTVIKPLATDVMTAQRKQMQGRMGGMRGMMGMMGRGRRGGADGGPGGPGGPPPMMMGEQSPEAEALQAAIDSESTTPEDLKAKLTAFREMQQKNEQALKDAREKLRAVLTLKQEAKLVLMGMLD